uniref:Spc34 n=1 Tax=Chaetomium thermophilum (strain DSM 1495 / CBS 144.50 / IMI 039719) TaxID=759272 RepID=UPI000D5032CB|nr:Chain J, Spc34 [Thermochaetoides thermophila DSM 1495]
MSLLSAHLEQISISCQGIDSLPFPPPKIFTNALLSNPDITSLIRDTEAHERALFSVPPPPPRQTTLTAEQQQQQKPSNRRQTVFNVTGGEIRTGGVGSASTARRNTAVAAVLGGDLHAQIMRGTRARPGQQPGSGDIDMEVLLRGVEKLCAVYPLPGALERVPVIRQKWQAQSNTLAYYEAKIAEQQEMLDRIAQERMMNDGDGDVEMEDVEEVGMTEEDLRREEEEVRELDKRKRDLQHHHHHH